MKPKTTNERNIKMKTKGTNIITMIGALALLGGGMAAPRAAATPVAFGSNHYEFVSGAVDWRTANDLSTLSIFDGVPGHLAVITSQAENDFLFGLAAAGAAGAGFAGSWIGGAGTGWTADGAYPESAQTYAAAGFENFGGIEPNNGPGFAYMHIGASQFAGINPSEWADSGGGSPSGGDPVIGFFIEYEGTNVNVPEGGSTLAMLGLAAFGLARMKRRKV
jgi:hypothetical protein